MLCHYSLLPCKALALYCFVFGRVHFSSWEKGMEKGSSVQCMGGMAPGLKGEKQETGAHRQQETRVVN